MGEEVAACCIFHDNSQVLVCQEAFLKAHNVGVYQHGMVEKLPLYILGHLPLKTTQHREETQGEEKAMPTDMQSSAMLHLRACYPWAVRMGGHLCPLHELYRNLHRERSCQVPSAEFAFSIGLFVMS